MKHILQNSNLKLCLAIVAMLSVSALHAQNWVNYRSAEMKVNMLFPKKPVEQPQTQQTAVGPINLHITMLDQSNDPSASNMVYMMNYSAFPDSISSDRQDKLGDFFGGSISGMVKNINGTLISQKTIAYKTFPGREIKVDVQGQGTITARLILIHNRFYILMAISATGKDKNPDVAKFLDSFQSE